MASWDFGTSNQYITGRVNASYSYNGIAANSYNVSVSLYYYKNSNSSTYGKVSGALCGYGYTTGKIYLNSSAGWVNVANVSFTVGADAAGNASCNISASGGISGTTFSSSSMSQTLYMSSGQTRQWTISYNANNGTGAPAAQTKTYGYILTLSSTVPTRSGYKFMGWATSSTATTAAFQPGGQFGIDATTTLYAVWQILTKITVKLYDTSYKVLSNGAGQVTKDSLSDLTIDMDITQEDLNGEVAGTKFYYRVLDSTKTIIGEPVGPYTPIEINDGGEFKSPTPTKEQILSSLKNNGGSETSMTFYVQISTGANTFEDDITVTQQANVTLIDFCKAHVSIDAITFSTTRYDVIYNLTLPKSYTITTAVPLILTRTPNAGSGTLTSIIVTKVGTSENGNIYQATYGFSLPSGDVDTIKAEYTDNINFTSTSRRVPKTVTPIYIDQSLNNKTGVCEALEFIEGENPGFDKIGYVFANEFVETDNGYVAIGDTMYFGEIVEK